MELETDAEHQQDDADLGQLLGQRGIGDEARRVRTHERPGEQVADDGGEAEALGEIAENSAAARPPVSVRMRVYSCMSLIELETA